MDSLQNNKPLFETDFSDELFKIEIIATKGGHKWKVSKIGDNSHPSYQEVIGTLEIVKQISVWKQMEANKITGEEYLKSEKLNNHD